MNRIEKRMQELQQRGEKALITYITAGLPDMEGTKKLIRAQEEAGVDVVELGIPFSDPVADGPVIQDASYRSILKGTTLRKVLAMVKELRAEGCEQPLIFMMYYNTVMSYGVQNFADACVKIGIDGLIIPDLPMEEQSELKEALAGREETVIIPSWYHRYLVTVFRSWSVMQRGSCTAYLPWALLATADSSMRMWLST